MAPWRTEAKRLAAINRAGAGVFVTVNRTNLRGRKEGDVEAARAIFCDLDGAPPIRCCAAS